MSVLSAHTHNYGSYKITNLPQSPTVLNLKSLFSSEVAVFPQNVDLCMIKCIVDAVYLKMLLH